MKGGTIGIFDFCEKHIVESKLLALGVASNGDLIEIADVTGVCGVVAVVSNTFAIVEAKLIPQNRIIRKTF